MDAECDLGTAYCQVMKLVCEETTTRVPFIVIHIGSKLMCLAKKKTNNIKLNKFIFQALCFFKNNILTINCSIYIIANNESIRLGFIIIIISYSKNTMIFISVHT